MKKPAPVNHPIHEILQHRWSPRVFDPQARLSEEALRSLLEAARWAPSSYNEQPWAFIVAGHDEPENHARLLSLLSEGNQQWAHAASVLLVALAKKRFEKTGRPNPHARHDLGQALAHLTFEATSRGIVVHQMAGFDQERATGDLGVPEGWEPVTAVAIGYPGNLSKAPEDLAERDRGPRQRRPQPEFVFRGGFGQPR